MNLRVLADRHGCAARLVRPATTPRRQGIAEVRKVAQFLTGTTVVLIGGHRRPPSYESLERDFGVKLVWVKPKAHQSVKGFEAPIARPDVTVVILAIRWCNHS
jgi:predicted dinucleotide-binding enzyme